jgi:1-acyl-sn-glycerol-3-phosphate acyltransferase
LRSIRFILFNALSWVTVIFFTLAVLISWPISSKLSYQFARGWCVVVVALARVVCGLRYRVIGLENIPHRSSVIFLKHSSAFETFAQLVFLPRSCWVLKRELLWAPFFGWTLYPLQAIAIDRSKGGAAVKQVISEGKRRLADGIFVSVFPEGTRMPAGETKRYGKSGTLLAQEAKTVILPVAHNAGYHWPRRGLGIIPGEVSFVIGKPIDPAGRSAADVNEEIQAWIEKTVAEIVAEDR